jgi:hypothetical protein
MFWFNDFTKNKHVNVQINALTYLKYPLSMLFWIVRWESRASYLIFVERGIDFQMFEENSNLSPPPKEKRKKKKRKRKKDDQGK